MSSKKKEKVQSKPKEAKLALPKAYMQRRMSANAALSLLSGDDSNALVIEEAKLDQSERNIPERRKSIYNDNAFRASNLSMQRNVISTHVIDLASGRPANNLLCKCYKWDKMNSEWILLGETVTNAQGRSSCVHPLANLSNGIFKLRYAIKEYYERKQQSSLYPYIDIVAEIVDSLHHYSIPLLINAYSYTTFLG